MSTLISNTNPILIPNKTIAIGCKLFGLIREPYFRFSVQCLIHADIFVMQVFFEIELGELGLLVPVPYAGFGIEPVQDWVIVHQLYLLIINRLEQNRA